MREYDTLIVGMGCAGLKCADELIRLNRRDFAIIADDPLSGTSRNAGSDKQTYYKLTLSGFEGDSVGEMARTYFSGGCVDGPHALSEAALSARCFFRLCELGVPFPRNEYGEYVGYRTDHDPRRRATSAGPLTSRQMTEALEKSVRAAGATVLDGLLAVKILTGPTGVRGLVCLNTQTNSFEVFRAANIVWATGGPASVYSDVVYPEGHFGMSGAAFLAGAKGVNLTEWQYGLASVKPRWNVSGTYMQALPRLISTDPDGNDAHEFLLPFFNGARDALTSVFLKGYQWPFDARKALNGSSRVDLCVLSEIRKGRRVFLDYRENPFGEAISAEDLSDEAAEYLSRAGALGGTPFSRLLHMNAPAVQFYRDHGVDLETEMLEISLCAQHMNGGIAVDEWWETDVRGLFAVGECAGTHGVYRPGGSALNAGQVGGARAAERIARRAVRAFDDIFNPEDEIEALKTLVNDCTGTRDTLCEIARKTAKETSLFAAAERDIQEISRMLDEAKALWTSFTNEVKISSVSCVPALFRFRDALATRVMLLSAMLAYAESGGGNRGSAVYINSTGKPTETDILSGFVQLTDWNGGNPVCITRPVKPIPVEDDFFENVWRKFREEYKLEE